MLVTVRESLQRQPARTAERCLLQFVGVLKTSLHGEASEMCNCGWGRCDHAGQMGTLRVADGHIAQAANIHLLHARSPQRVRPNRGCTNVVELNDDSLGVSARKRLPTTPSVHGDVAVTDVKLMHPQNASSPNDVS